MDDFVIYECLCQPHYFIYPQIIISVSMYATLNGIAYAYITLWWSWIKSYLTLIEIKVQRQSSNVNYLNMQHIGFIMVYHNIIHQYLMPKDENLTVMYTIRLKQYHILWLLSNISASFALVSHIFSYIYVWIANSYRNNAVESLHLNAMRLSSLVLFINFSR